MGNMTIAIIGCGIAGAATAARLADFDRVVHLIDMTPFVPFHTTGRSAALKDPVYVPNAEVGALARASADFLEKPSAVFGPLLRPRGSMHIADWRNLIHLLDLQDAVARAQIPHRLLERDALAAEFPHLREEFAHAAIVTGPEVAQDIDVNALHAGFMRTLRHLGGIVRLGEEFIGAKRIGGAWRVETSVEVFCADAIVIAAGPWADEVAVKCGAPPLGLTPLRRTIAVGDLDRSVYPAPDALIPFTFWVGAGEDCYFRLEKSGEIWVSPADETPSDPCDAVPEDIDVAIAIERLEQRTHFRLRPHLRRRWAGLRTFAPDRKPVIGWDPIVRDLFWSAGYGGFGIECAPAASLLAADLFDGKSKVAAELGDTFEIDADAFSPMRLRARHLAS